MRHAGALRNFASTVAALAAGGHRVHLVFMMPDKRGDGRLLRALRREHPGVTGGDIVPGRPPGLWRDVARTVRTTGDYARYWTGPYARAHALRRRAAARVPAGARAIVDHPLARTRACLPAVLRVLRLADEAVPVDPRVAGAIAAVQPDLVLVTPLVDLGSEQVEYVKAARALGVRSALAVHSWDNLTNKGLLRIQPDRLFVWNAAQRREAETLHGVPASRVVVTGAPVYDQWFDRTPSTTRDAFCRTVGLDPGRPLLLYLCSSAFIAGDETAFVVRWMAAVRASSDPRLRSAGILIRPHPDNVLPWQRFDPAPDRAVAVWPRGGAEPIDRASRDDYFDTLHHADAAVGINTSAQIEAGIVGLPVHTVRVPEYEGTQDGTLHFHHLLPEQGGPLEVADDLGAHVRALEAAVRRGRDARRLSGFVGAFVRPHGADVPATPLLVDAIARLASMPRPAPERDGSARRTVRIVLRALWRVAGAWGAVRRRLVRDRLLYA